MPRAASRQRSNELAAERMRKTRERRDQAKWVLHVDVDNMFGDACVAAGLVPQADESDKSKIADAASFILRAWMKSVLRRASNVARNAADSRNMPSSPHEDRPVETPPPRR